MDIHIITHTDGGEFTQVVSASLTRNGAIETLYYFLRRRWEEVHCKLFLAEDNYAEILGWESFVDKYFDTHSEERWEITKVPLNKRGFHAYFISEDEVVDTAEYIGIEMNETGAEKVICRLNSPKCSGMSSYVEGIIEAINSEE